MKNKKTGNQKQRKARNKKYVPKTNNKVKPMSPLDMELSAPSRKQMKNIRNIRQSFDVGTSDTMNNNLFQSILKTV